MYTYNLSVFEGARRANTCDDVDYRGGGSINRRRSWGSGGGVLAEIEFPYRWKKEKLNTNTRALRNEFNVKKIKINFTLFYYYHKLFKRLHYNIIIWYTRYNNNNLLLLLSTATTKYNINGNLLDGAANDNNTLTKSACTRLNADCVSACDVVPVAACVRG